MERWQQHDPYIKKLRKASKDLLDQCKPKVKELGVTKIDMISEEGNAAEKILQIADGKEVDTIVVGSRDTN
jgi:nucleotide-binding universal stress UspA family protein